MSNIHIALDLETLSLKPDAMIASVGLSAWVEGEQTELEGLHLRLDLNDQKDRDFDANVFNWWIQQDPKVVKSTFVDGAAYKIADAQRILEAWIAQVSSHGTITGVWSNDPSFDMAKFKSMFGEKLLHYRATRCMRTARHALEHLGHHDLIASLDRDNMHHNALSDARWGAGLVRLYLEHVLGVQNEQTRTN